MNKAATQEIIDKAAERYGKIKAGENPARPIAIPQKMTEETKVMKTARTVAEAGATPFILVPEIEAGVVKGMFNYTPEKNATLVEESQEGLRHCRLSEGSV